LVSTAHFLPPKSHELTWHGTNHALETSISQNSDNEALICIASKIIFEFLFSFSCLDGSKKATGSEFPTVFLRMYLKSLTSFHAKLHLSSTLPGCKAKINDY